MHDDKDNDLKKMKPDLFKIVKIFTDNPEKREKTIKHLFSFCVMSLHTQLMPMLITPFVTCLHVKFVYKFQINTFRASNFSNFLLIN